MMKKNIIILFYNNFFNAIVDLHQFILKNKNANFSIEQINFTGDRELNNFLKINLNQ